MTTLAHISDLHFGREDPRLTEALLAALDDLAPDVIVVSGDFTQRAKKRQFRAARAFLRELPNVPRLVVPGNHDVSTTNLIERALRPLRRYRRYITPDLAPYLQVPGVAVAGINTVRVVATKDGRINAQQVEAACVQLARSAADAVRVVVTHHPMDLPASDTRHALVTRAGMAMRRFAECGVDLFLSGHLHSGLAITTVARYPGLRWAAVVAHAGTAISTRTRGEPNAWNVVRLEHDEMTVEQRVWEKASFAVANQVSFRRGDGGWRASGDR